MCRRVADWNYVAPMPLDWFTKRAFFFSILNPYRKSSWEQATEKTEYGCPSEVKINQPFLIIQLRMVLASRDNTFPSGE